MCIFSPDLLKSEIPLLLTAHCSLLRSYSVHGNVKFWNFWFFCPCYSDSGKRVVVDSAILWKLTMILAQNVFLKCPTHVRSYQDPTWVLEVKSRSPRLLPEHGFCSFQELSKGLSEFSVLRGTWVPVIFCFCSFKEPIKCLSELRSSSKYFIWMIDLGIIGVWWCSGLLGSNLLDD